MGPFQRSREQPRRPSSRGLLLEYSQGKAIVTILGRNSQPISLVEGARGNNISGDRPLTHRPYKPGPAHRRYLRSSFSSRDLKTDKVTGDVVHHTGDRIRTVRGCSTIPQYFDSTECHCWHLNDVNQKLSLRADRSGDKWSFGVSLAAKNGWALALMFIVARSAPALPEARSVSHQHLG